MNYNELLTYLIQFLVVLFAISIHESAHAWMADRCGDPTARLQGRVTLNPIPHIDPIGTIIFPGALILIGLFTDARVFIFGWAKPVMVNPVNLRDPARDNVLISAAGPVSNIATGIFGIGIFFFLSKVGVFRALPITLDIFYFLIIISFLLAIFNLIPTYPLDGSGIVEGMLRGSAREAFMRTRPYGFLILIALFYLNVLDFIFRPIVLLINSVLGPALAM